jgi:hypothetical protein
VEVESAVAGRRNRQRGLFASNQPGVEVVAAAVIVGAGEYAEREDRDRDRSHEQPFFHVSSCES